MRFLGTTCSTLKKSSAEIPITKSEKMQKVVFHAQAERGGAKETHWGQKKIRENRSYGTTREKSGAYDGTYSVAKRTAQGRKQKKKETEEQHSQNARGEAEKCFSGNQKNRACLACLTFSSENAGVP